MKKVTILLLLVGKIMFGQIEPDSTKVINPLTNKVLFTAKNVEELLIGLDSIGKNTIYKKVKIKNFYPKGITGSYIITRKEKNEKVQTD